MKIFDKFFRRKKIKNLIAKVNEALYQHHWRYDEFFKKEFYGMNTADKLQIYIAINAATKLTEPLTTRDIEAVLDAITDAERTASVAGFEHLFTELEALAKNSWITKLEYINKGKQAKKRNKYSYEGAIYSCEMAKKGPSSSAERNKWKQLCTELTEAEYNYNDHIAKKKKQQDEADEADSYAKAEAVVKKIVAEVEEEKRLNGTKSQEQIELEREEIMRGLKQSLANLKKTDEN